MFSIRQYEDEEDHWLFSNIIIEKVSQNKNNGALKSIETEVSVALACTQAEARRTGNDRSLAARRVLKRTKASRRVCVARVAQAYVGARV